MNTNGQQHGGTGEARKEAILNAVFAPLEGSPELAVPAPMGADVRTVNDPTLEWAYALKLERPMVFFDFETTGTDVGKDRVVSYAFTKVIPDQVLGDGTRLRFPAEARGGLINPGIPIPAEATKVHWITDEMVKDQPRFFEIASWVEQFLAGCDLAGYNVIHFDIPLLWEEMNRAGIRLDLAGARVVDACCIFKRKEERTLSAALKFYCGREHENAHGAAGDVRATIDVTLAQIARYEELRKMDVAGLAEYARHDDRRADLSGKLVYNDKGEMCYGIGKAKGQRVCDDPGFGRWMLNNDFPAQTKMVLMEELGKIGK